MNRCALPWLTRRHAALAVLAFAHWLGGPSAYAQTPRNFPAAALRGIISFTAPPEVLLNGVVSRLAPGIRIHAQDNMLESYGVAAGQKLVVNYTTDMLGQPLEVWVLRPEEAAKQPWPRTAAEAQAWQFDYTEQVWTRP